MPAPQKNVAFTFDVPLVAVANRPQFKANPTLATGDWKISKDNGALTNLGTLPVVSPASSRIVKVVLAQAEMNADRITVVGVDAAGDEWDEVVISINTTAKTIDTLNDITVAAILTTQLTESYAADGSAPTIAQALMMIQQLLGEFSISGTVLTMKKVDGSTEAATFTLSDDTNPTSLTRAS